MNKNAYKKGRRQQCPVENYFKSTMLEDPWSACTAVQVTEVAKQQASSTRHRFRLFTRLEQKEDKDGMEDLDGPGKFLIMTYRKVKALV